MTLVGNISKYKDEQDELDLENSIPAIYQHNKKDDSLKNAIIIATLLHPLVVGIVGLSLFILSLLGINFDLLKKPPMPNKDIEFVLVTREAPPIDKNTKNRADKNSRAGGKHDPTRHVAEPSMPSPNKKLQPAAAPKTNAPVKKTKVQNKVSPKQTVQPQTTVQNKQEIVAPKAPKAPLPGAARSKLSVPKANINPQSTMKIPFPKVEDYKNIGPAAGGPVTSSSKGTSSATGSSLAKGSGTPSPSFLPSKSSGGSGKFSNGSVGGGNYGNPSPGNPNGIPGIDAIKEPDFGPYMKELQRRIKMNWAPPNGNESKRVVLLFTIKRDGQVSNIQVSKSSGSTAADNAAIAAVKLTAPFRTLPAEYRGNSIDIQFTFDYNVFGASRY